MEQAAQLKQKNVQMKKDFIDHLSKILENLDAQDSLTLEDEDEEAFSLFDSMKENISKKIRK
jgi:hypothetical protein